MRLIGSRGLEKVNYGSGPVSHLTALEMCRAPRIPRPAGDAEASDEPFDRDVLFGPDHLEVREGG